MGSGHDEVQTPTYHNNSPRLIDQLYDHALKLKAKGDSLGALEHLLGAYARCDAWLSSEEGMQSLDKGGVLASAELAKRELTQLLQTVNLATLPRYLFNEIRYPELLVNYSHGG